MNADWERKGEGTFKRIGFPSTPLYEVDAFRFANCGGQIGADRAAVLSIVSSESLRARSGLVPVFILSSSPPFAGCL